MLTSCDVIALGAGHQSRGTALVTRMRIQANLTKVDSHGFGLAVAAGRANSF